MKRNFRLIMKKNKIIILNYLKIYKITNELLKVDDILINGSKLEITEIVEGCIKIYGEKFKIEER